MFPKNLSQETIDNATRQLVRLADAMEGCDHGSREYNWYAKEYRRYSKLLFPEAYPKNKRKPSQRFIQTLNECSCGSRYFKLQTDVDKGVRVICGGECKVEGVYGKNRSEARDNWNKLKDNQQLNLL